jgi:hypothetical protein
MGITGRYDFKGIQKALGALIDALVAGTSWGAWLLASPFAPVIRIVRDLLINFLANRGLIVLNVGAIMVDGAVDQSKLDTAMTDALNKMKIGRDKITPAQGKKIDDQVREAFDRDADVGATNGADSLPDVSSNTVRSGNNTPV